MELNIQMEKNCNLLGALFQQIIGELKVRIMLILYHINHAAMIEFMFIFNIIEANKGFHWFGLG